MTSTAILLLVASTSVLQQNLMPEWAHRALEAGIADPSVEFRYEISDECALLNLRLVEAYPGNQWQTGEEAELLEIASKLIGPFDTAAAHDGPLLKESKEIAQFERAHYESRGIMVNSDDHTMWAECVFGSGELLYVNARTRDSDGSLRDPKRIDESLSSFGSSTIKITFLSDLGVSMTPNKTLQTDKGKLSRLLHSQNNALQTDGAWSLDGHSDAGALPAKWLDTGSQLGLKR